MLCMFDIGIISLRNNVLTWKIPNFFSLPLTVGREIRTQEFKVTDDSRFTLAIWPRGLNGSTGEWFGVCLYTCNTVHHNGSIEFSIVKDGRSIKRCLIDCSENGLYRNDWFMEWSEFLLRKSEIAPDGCLTMVCRISIDETDVSLDEYAENESTTSVKDVNGFTLTSPLQNPQIAFQCGDYTYNADRDPSFNSGIATTECPTSNFSGVRCDATSTINSFFSLTDSMADRENYEPLSKTFRRNIKKPSVPGSTSEKKRAEQFCSKTPETNSEHSRVRSASKVSDTVKDISVTKTSESALDAKDITSEITNPFQRENNSESTPSDAVITNSSNIAVAKEKMVPCPACLGSTSQTVQSVTKDENEKKPSCISHMTSESRPAVPFTPSVSPYEEDSTKINVSTSCVAETTTSYTPSSNTSNFGSVSNSRQLPSASKPVTGAGGAACETRPPAWVCFSSDTIAGPVNLGKGFIAEAAKHKGEQITNGIECSHRLQEPPIIFRSDDYACLAPSSISPSLKLTTEPQTTPVSGFKYNVPTRINSSSSSDSTPIADIGSVNSEKAVATAMPSASSSCHHSPCSSGYSSTHAGSTVEESSNTSQVYNPRGAEASYDAKMTESSKSSFDGIHSNEEKEAFYRALKSLEKLSRCFEKMYLEGKDFDLTIKIKDREFRAHRAVLKHRSPVFAELLSHNEAENGGDVISIDACDPEKFHDFLRFVYSGKTENLSGGNMCSLYCIAHKYDLPELKEECVELIKKSLSTTTICDIVSLATEHNEVELLAQATIFFARNLKDILGTPNWQLFMKEKPLQATEMYSKSLDIAYTKKAV